MSFDIVVATDLENGIGIGNTLPWRLKADLLFFKTLTSAPSQEGLLPMVIMGKNTWLSLPESVRPLPNRLNLVLSRSGLSLPRNVLYAPSLDDALTPLSPHQPCFVIGGGQVYTAALNHSACKKIYRTKIHSRFECDTFFPEFDGTFVKVSSSPVQEENGLLFEFETWEKKSERLI